ncbi:unnamed protein product [Brassicogethes aeneus]|uniref:Fork-head domain-containing protein n=1 Tax=Brassicogethes aeneus TaxID=1431903 RepID=A0A9P0B130_BRAAE|nr:unnamed protein product [Brassicogethes aeneus]
MGGRIEKKTLTKELTQLFISMNLNMNMEPLAEVDGFEPQTRARSNTWPLPRPENYVEPTDETGNKCSGLPAPLSSSGVPTKKNSSRRNAWGNLSYADLITQAITTSPDKRLTLSQIYEWMVQNVPYFKDKGDSNSSAGWKIAMAKKKSINAADEKRREQVRLNMKRMRERIKGDAAKHEEYKRKERERYNQRKESGKIKSISDMSETQKDFADELCKSMCCNNELKEECLSRICENCKNIELDVNEYDSNLQITYKSWYVKKEKVIIKNKEKNCQKTNKDKITTCGELVASLKQNIPKYMLHFRNIIHQYNFFNKIKTDLTNDTVIIHMDFSENYQCKYSQEVQSAHFGGSKPQVSLHTVVIYYLCPESNSVRPISCCSISDNLRHDSIAIYAHLQPIFTKVRQLVPHVKIVHFQSDGPSTQYRNKKMFNILANHISKDLKAEKVYWHFSESGHGKGAPDGIGAAVKQLADALVARGSDIPNFESLVDILAVHKKKIQIYPATAKNISDFDNIVPDTIRPFKETFGAVPLANGIKW